MSTIIEKLKNKLTTAVNNRIAPEEIQSSRLATCDSCEHLIKITRQCSKCFCVVDGKVLFKNSKCPIGKW
jgi:hypothetical protein